MESLNLLKFYLCVIDYQVTLVMGVRLEILGQELFSLYTLSPSLKCFVPYFHTPVMPSLYLLPCTAFVCRCSYHYYRMIIDKFIF